MFVPKARDSDFGLRGPVRLSETCRKHLPVNLAAFIFRPEVNSYA